MKKPKRIPVQKKFHVRSGDVVEVISGNHKTKTGRILRVDRQKLRAYVEGVNMVKKATRKSPQNPDGGILSREGSVHISNLRVLEKYDHKAAAQPAKK